MNCPDQYELKKWLCRNTVKGLILHHYQVGVDTSDTDWELIPVEGKPMRVKANSVKPLVEIRPDWIRIMSLHSRFVNEVVEYEKFKKANAAELATYKRLKAKFEGNSDEI